MNTFCVKSERPEDGKPGRRARRFCNGISRGKCPYNHFPSTFPLLLILPTILYLE